MTQPVGPLVPGWTPRPRPARDLVLEGRRCRLEPLDADRHAAALHAAFAPGGDALWTYIPVGPWPDAARYADWVRGEQGAADPRYLAILVEDEPLGVASYLRIDPDNGTMEVGFITLSPALQRTTAATEAMALMMAHAFDALGYRRYEWKCDALNAPSRAAAERLGFTFEGIHRQARIVKGRSRDTAWYSITDAEWPRVRAALAAWLDPANFDAGGRQLSPLRAAPPAASPPPPGSAAG